MKIANQWDLAVNLYNENMGEAGDPLNRDIIAPAVLDLIGDLNNKIVLDSGCGSGYFTTQLAHKAKKVYATDFSRKFIELCRSKYGKIKNLEFNIHDIGEKMQYNDGFFDVILSKMVLQYSPDISRFAKESYRVLTAGGILVIAVDHPFNSQFYYAQQVAGRINPKYNNLNDYFSHEAHTKLSLWGKAELTWYPKTVGDYVNPFLKSGLKLEEMLELPEEKDGIKIPRIMVLKFSK